MSTEPRPKAANDNDALNLESTSDATYTNKNQSQPLVNQGSTMSAEPTQENIDPLGFDVSDEEQEALEAAINGDGVREAEADLEAAIMNDMTQQANPNVVRGSDELESPALMQSSQDTPELDTTNMPPLNEFPYSDDTGMDEANRDYDDIDPYDDFPTATQDQESPAPAAAAKQIVPDRSYVDTLNAQIEQNGFYQNPAIDKFEIEERLTNANTELDNLGVSDAMRVGILHQELAHITNDIRDNLLTAQGLTVEQKDIITAGAAEGLNIASRHHLNSSENLNDFSEPANAPYSRQGLGAAEQSVLYKSTRDIPQGARQYAFSQLVEAQKGNDNLSFEATVNNLRQSLSDFDQTYKQINPSASSELDNFNALIHASTNENNAKNVAQISNPAFTPINLVNATPAATTAAPTTGTPTPAAPTAGAPTSAAPTPVQQPTTGAPTPVQPPAEAVVTPANVVPSPNSASTASQQDPRDLQDQEIPEPTTPIPQVGGGGTSYSLFGGFNVAPESTPAPTPTTSAPAQNESNDQVQPLTNDANANTQTDPLAISAERQIAINRTSLGENLPPTDIPARDPRNSAEIISGVNAAFAARNNLDAADKDQESTAESENTQTNVAEAGTVEQEQPKNDEVKQERQKGEQDAQKAKQEQEAKQQQQAQVEQAQALSNPSVVSPAPTSSDELLDSEASADVSDVNPDSELSGAPDGGKSQDNSDEYDGLSDDQIIAKNLADTASSLASKLLNSNNSAQAQEVNEINQADQNTSPEQAASIADNIADSNAKVAQEVSDSPNPNDNIEVNPTSAAEAANDNSPKPEEAAPAPKPAPKRFSDRFADDINQGLRDHHESLMRKYADDSTTDEELYSETEKFLENYETLNERAATLAQENQGKNQLLEQYRKGLEETAKLKDDIYQKAESKNLLNPDHPLNIEAAKQSASSEKKNGLGEKFGSMGEGAEKAMQAIADAMSNAATAVAGMFGGKKQ